MADKTTGELQSVKIEDLPSSLDIYDDLKMPGELQGEAVHVTGAQLKIYAQEATRAYAESAALSASSASDYAASSQSSFQGVKDAIDNLPDGVTVIINDLTTGGKAAALSAEMGRQLENSKMSFVTPKSTTADSADNLTVPFVLLKLNNGLNQELHEKLGKPNYAYVMTHFYYSAATNQSRFQLAVGYQNPSRMLIRQNHSGAWGDWRECATTDVALLKADKPSGSYTGGGDPTQKTVDIGGFGNAVLIYNAYGTGIVTEYGGFVVVLQGNTAGTVTPYLAKEAKFVGGVLTLATDSIWINASGATYIYQVL